MSFDIAIYNANCFNGNRAINSVKAAYLYGDKVRVYDIPRAYDFDEKGVFDLLNQNNAIIVGLLQKYPQLSLENPIMINSDPRQVISAMDELEVITKNEMQRISKLAIDHSKDDQYPLLDGILEISNALTRVISMEKETTNDFLLLKSVGERQFDIYYYKKMYDILLNIELMRLLTRPGYTNESYYYELSLLNVETIESSVDLKMIVDDNNGFLNSFFNDKGFKIMNGTPDSNMESIFPSMWVPSYLSEYAISSLPGFEEATVDEIVDIRKELNKYVIPYRAAILKMAENIKEIPDTESLQMECMLLYLRDIEPQVAAINTAIADNNVIKNIAKSFITSEKTWASMGALATAFITSGDIANALSVGTAAAFGGWSIAKSIVASLEEKKKIKDNELFFLYQAGKKLKK